MKYVDWENEEGFKRRSMLRDQDLDSHAESGVPVGPPNVKELDWDGIQRDLNNRLFDLGLFSWNDIQRDSTDQKLISAIMSVMRKRLIELYRRNT